MIYCLVPRELAPKLHDLLRRHFRDDAGVEVVVERRGCERRAVGDRREAAGEGRSAVSERRRIRNLEGRRVDDRRAAIVEVEAPPLPRRVRAHTERLRFVERVAPTEEQAEDVDTARLVTRIQSGDREGYSDLYMRYFDRVYAYLRMLLRDSHEAEDLAQQVFVKMLESLSDYERRRQPFRAWLFTIVRHLALAHLRRQRRVQLTEPSEIARRRERDELEPAPDASALRWIADRELLLFVERLPASQRQILVMRFMLDLQPSEIAEMLDTTSAAVRQAQTRAIAVLRERLAAAGRSSRRHERRAPYRRGAPQSRVLRIRRFSLRT
jgi:RNA polymerase sigma-70 factor (ECF subfamily)